MKALGIKLKNRRVLMSKVDDGYQILFKRLGKKNEPKIVKTPLALSDEAMQAVIRLFIDLNDVDSLLSCLLHRHKSAMERIYELGEERARIFEKAIQYKQGEKTRK